MFLIAKHQSHFYTHSVEFIFILLIRPAYQLNISFYLGVHVNISLYSHLVSGFPLQLS